MKIRIECFQLNGLTHFFRLPNPPRILLSDFYTQYSVSDIEMNTTHPIWKVALIIFLIDLFWLGTGGIFGRKMIERIQGKPIEFRYVSAILVYLLLAYMLLEAKTYKQAFMYGVSIYGVYEFTNLAVFTDYDVKFAIADTLWGGLLLMFSKYMLQAF
jgi:uncharacterized membrane protein